MYAQYQENSIKFKIQKLLHTVVHVSSDVYNFLHNIKTSVMHIVGQDNWMMTVRWSHLIEVFAFKPCKTKDIQNSFT